MKAYKSIVLTLLTVTLPLTGCNKNTTNPEDIPYQVSNMEWANLFDLEVLVTSGNFKVQAVFPGRYEALMYFDCGKIAIYDARQRPIPDSTTPFKEEECIYLDVKATENGYMFYDYYENYYDEWTVVSESAKIADFFIMYGFFEFNYGEFSFDSKLKSYVGHLGDDYDLDVTISIYEGQLKQIIYYRESGSAHYNFSNYGTTSVTLPVIQK